MGFGFHSVEHAFASVARDIVKTASVFSLVASRIEKAEPEIEAVTGAIYPPAVLIERAAFGLLGAAANAASGLDEASIAKGLHLQLDEQSIRQLQEIAKVLETHVQAFKKTSLFEPPRTPAPTAA